MIAFVGCVIGCIICFVLAVLGTTTKPKPPPDPDDYGFKDVISGKMIRDFNDHSDSQVAGQEMLIVFWVLTVALLIGAVFTGIAAFG